MDEDYRYTQEIRYGVNRRDLENGQIVVFSLQHYSHEIGDSLFMSILKLQATHSPEVPFLMVVDFSRSLRAILTSQIRKRGNEIALQTPANFYGRVAFITPRLLAWMILPLQKQMLQDLQKRMPQMELKFFGDLENALVWLREKLAVGD